MEKKSSSRVRNYLVGAGIALVLVCGCIFGLFVSRPSEGAIQTAIAQTQAVAPTNTTVPTKAATSTKTPSPTPAPTNTPVPPETLTAMAVEREQTRAADQLTATVELRNIRSTQMASYGTIDWRELTTYPNNHIGEKVRVSGNVFNIVSGTRFQMWISGTQEAVVVDYIIGFDDLFENTSVVVYGEVKGTECFTNQLGGQVCQPWLSAQFYTK